MAKERKKGRPGLDREEVRRKLLTQGLALLASKGPHSLTVAEIAAAAGVAKGTFFNLFGSKDRFWGTLAQGVLRELAGQVQPLGLTPTPPQELLGSVAAVHLRYFQLRPQAAALLQLASPPALPGPAGEMVAAGLRRYLRFLAGLVGPPAEALGWPSGQGEPLALWLLAMSSSLARLGGALGIEELEDWELPFRLGRLWARGLAAG